MQSLTWQTHGCLARHIKCKQCDDDMLQHRTAGATSVFMLQPATLLPLSLIPVALNVPMRL